MTGLTVTRLGNALKWASVQASERGPVRILRDDGYRNRLLLARLERARARKARAFKLLQCLRARLYQVCKRRNTKRAGRTLELLGCTIHELIDHLEWQFKRGMSWDNYGKWHVDHIRPCASFNLSKRADQKACFHYTNLQPLWAEDNLWKGKRWTPPVLVPGGGKVDCPKCAG